MKKTYIKPTTETMHICTENMIMTSGKSVTFKDDNDTGGGLLNNDYAEGDAMSKDRSIFGLDD